MTKKKEIRFGKLPPQYIFILNPYAEYRFTRCPSCERKMRQCKLPLGHSRESDESGGAQLHLSA